MSLSNTNPQSTSTATTGNFNLIWYYWYKRYIYQKNKKISLGGELEYLKQKYRIETIQSSSSQNLQSSISNSYNNQINLFTNPPFFYVINPELEGKCIEEILIDNCGDCYDKQQQCKQMINQLHSYYLNSKTVFIIYKQEKDSIIQQTVSKLINSSFNDGSLRASKLNISSFLNDSILQSYDKMQDKIQNLQLGDKLAQLDGLQIWNAKYYSIPHCYVKVKKSCWARSLSVSTCPNNQAILHPCQPRPISSLPIIPKIRKYRPSIDKLQPFVSFIKILWALSPNLSPTCQSIFEYNGLPYIFTQDVKQQSIAILCYFIVFGNRENNLTEKYVERWMVDHSNTVLCKRIRYMEELFRNKHMQSKEMNMRVLLDQNDQIW